MGMLARHGLDPRCFERRRVERAPRAWLLVARAEPFLAEHRIAAGEQFEVVTHPAAVMLDKADHPPVMVAMRVAEDQAVEPLGHDAEQVEIAQEDLRRIAEIEEVLAARPGAFRFEMQREAPFAGEGRGLATANTADMLDCDMGMRRLRHELVKERIDNDAHRQRGDLRCFERLGGRESHGFSFRWMDEAPAARRSRVLRDGASRLLRVRFRSVIHVNRAIMRRIIASLTKASLTAG